MTLALTDPDAPARDNPEWSEMCHWIARVAVGSEEAEGWTRAKRTEIEDGLEIEIVIETEGEEWEVMPCESS